MIFDEITKGQPTWLLTPLSFGMPERTLVCSLVASAAGATNLVNPAAQNGCSRQAKLDGEESRGHDALCGLQ